MAKIPRIEQGDRPSATYSPTLDASVANMVGSLGDLSGEMLATATAEEQAERKRLAEAFAAKQAVVNASNEGLVNMEFENSSYKVLQRLETDYADNPDVIPAKYQELMGEEQKALMDREDLNDTVKLGAVKNAESTMSSGLRQSYSISSSLQTKKVKGNLAKSTYNFANTASFLGSPEAVAALSSKFIAAERKNYVAIHGKDADAKLQEDISKAYGAWGEMFSDTNPGQYLALAPGNKLLKENVPPEKFQALRKSAEASLSGMGKRKQNEIFVEAVRRGSVITKAYDAGQLDPGTILATKEAWKLKIADLNTDVNISEEARKKAVSTIERELKVLGTMDLMRRQENKSNLLPDDELPANITEARKKIFGKDTTKRAKTKDLGELLKYKEMIIRAESEEFISPAAAATYRKEVDLSMEKAVKKERNNTTSFWTPDNAKEIGNTELDNLFERDMPGASEQERNRATIQFVKMWNARTEAGKEPTEAEAPKMAQDAFRIARGLGPASVKK